MSTTAIFLTALTAAGLVLLVVAENPVQAGHQGAADLQ